jgi:hypothetical protein
MKYFINNLKKEQVLEWYNTFIDSMSFDTTSVSYKAFMCLKDLISNCNNEDLIIKEKSISSVDGGFIVYIPYKNWDDINENLKPYIRRRIWGENIDFELNQEISFLGFEVNCFLYDVSENSEFKKEDLQNEELREDKYIAFDIILEKPI